MSRIYYLILLFLLPALSCGQPVFELPDTARFDLTQYQVLPDRGYTLAEILAGSTPAFSPDDSLRLGKADGYWVKIVIANPSAYARSYDVRMTPYIDNTIYSFDYNAQKWRSHRAGILTNSTYERRLQGILPCTMQARTTNTIYIRANFSSLKQYDYVLKPAIQFSTREYVSSVDRNLWIAWVAGIAILFLFFLNNLYIYYSFRDKTVLFYLIAQLGGMIYVTSYRHFFSVLFHCPVFTFWLTPTGRADYYDLNFLLMHIGIIGIMYGFVQFTRSFFDTAKTLPVLNRMLKYGLIVHLSITITVVVINCTVFCMEHFSMMFENFLALVLFTIIFFTCIMGYVRKLRAAGPFLLANMLPLIFMLGITVIHLILGPGGTDNSFLPEMAIVGQSLGFSIALVARTKLIQKELKAKDIQARQLEFDLRELTLTQRLTEMENQKITAEMLHEKTMNEVLQERLETNQRELASTTIYMVQKNKLLSGLKDQIQELHELYPESRHDGLKNIESILKSDLYLEADWEKFRLHFEQVHPRFFEDLRARHPNLTKNEIRIYAYFHINLSTKEIASLLNIDPASVRRAKTRLYKKMSISEF